MKGKGAFLKTLRVVIGLVLLVYSVCLLSSFFSASVRTYLNSLGQNYAIIGFLFSAIFATPEFSHLSLFIGSIYFTAALAIVSLKPNPRIGASYILLSIWVFLVFILALKVKEGFGTGFSTPEFVSSLAGFFKIMAPLAIPALFLPFFAGDE